MALENQIMQVLLVIRERENHLFLEACKYLSGIESRNLAEPRGAPLTPGIPPCLAMFVLYHFNL